MLRFAQIVEMVRVQFREHHPTLKIVLATLEFANDFPFRFGVFAELQFCDGAAIHGRQFFGLNDIRRVGGNRHGYAHQCQAEQGQSTQIINADVGQQHGDRAGDAEGFEIRAGLFLLQAGRRAGDHPAKRERRPIRANNEDTPPDNTQILRKPWIP